VELADKLKVHRTWIEREGVDMPEISAWRWPGIAWG
jgi:phosphoketolase